MPAVSYAKDVPDKIDLIYVETPRPNGPFGAAGAAEASAHFPPCRYSEWYI